MEKETETTLLECLPVVGSISLANPNAKDALQAHCCTPEQDGAGLPPTLPPALTREQPSKAHSIPLVRLRQVPNHGSISPEPQL